MEREIFKKAVRDCLGEFAFRYDRETYFYDSEYGTVVVKLQKSSYDHNDYYINYGFVVKELHLNLKSFKISDCDFNARFINRLSDIQTDLFSLKELDAEDLKDSLEYNINTFVVPFVNAGIKTYFELFPERVLLAKRELKNYLEKGNCFLD